MNTHGIYGQIEDAYWDLSHEPMSFYVFVRDGGFILGNSARPGAKFVGEFTKMERLANGTWRIFPVTDFREAIERAMTALRPA